MSPDKSAEAIDLTLDLTSDSDDDVRPICLSSSPTTPLRSASIEVIGEIFSSGRLSHAQSRPSQTSFNSPGAETSTSGSVQRDSHDTFSTALARTPVEQVHKEPSTSHIPPTRPRPRRRTRPNVENEDVVLPKPFDKGFQQPFSPLSPEPCTLNTAEEFEKDDDVRANPPMQTDYPDDSTQMEYQEDIIQMEYDEDTLVRSPYASKQAYGDSTWGEDAELEEINGEAAIYLPSHQGTAGLQVGSEDVPLEAFSRLMSRMDQPITGAVEWQELDELLHDSSGLSISLPLGEEAMQLDALPDAISTAEGSEPRSDSVYDDADSWTVQETVAAALETRSRSQSSIRGQSIDTSQSNGRSLSPPIASRIGLRNRKKSLEMAKASDQREPDPQMSSPSTSIATESRESILRASVSSASSSSFSTLNSGPAGPGRPERPSGRRRGGVSARVRATMFEDESNPLSSTETEDRIEHNTHITEEQHVEQELPRLGEEDLFARERTMSSHTEDDWCILPDFNTPTKPKPHSGSQQSTVRSPQTSPRNRRKDSVNAGNAESPNTMRRGTRMRKATDKKEYVPLSYIMRTSCRESLAVLATSAAPPTTPGAGAGPSAPLFHQSPIAQKSPSRAIPSPTGKSLSRVISSLTIKSSSLTISSLAVKSPSLAVKSPSLAHSPASNASSALSTISPPRRRREPSQAHGSESKGGTSNARRLRRNNISLAEIPTLAVPIASTSHRRPQDSTTQKVCQIAHFPPSSISAEPNEYLIASDVRDSILMAVCAVLHEGGNKAISTKAHAAIYSAIRSYQRRIAKASCLGRKSLLAKHTFQGYLAEAYLTPGVHLDVLAMANSSSNGPKGAFWYLEGNYGSLQWESPFAKLEQPEKVQLHFPATETAKQRARKAPKVRGSDTSRQAAPDSAMKPRPRLRQKSYENEGSSHAAASTFDAETSASSSESDGDNGNDRLSKHASSVAENCGGDESAFAFYSNFDCFSESDSAYHTESDGEFDTDQLGANLPKKVAAQQCASALAISEKFKYVEDATSVLGVIGSPGPDIALFPDNPLGPVRWEQGSKAFSYTFLCDDASSLDASQHSDDNDVAMQDVGSESAELFLSKLPFCSPRLFDYGLLWDERQALFANTPELVDEDYDTTAATPVSSADSASLADLPYQRDSSTTCDREASAEPLLDLKEMGGESLADVVQMLGALLPPIQSIPHGVQADVATPKKSYTTHIRTGQRAPRFFASRMDPSSMPLGLPTCRTASPLSSPCSTSTREEFCRITPLPTLPCASGLVDTGTAMIEVHELDFLSSSQKQMSQIDIDPEDISFFEHRNRIDISHHACDLRNTKDAQVEQDDRHQGPESVLISELDDLLGESADVLPVTIGPALTTWTPSGFDSCVSPSRTSRSPVASADAERHQVTLECGNVEQHNFTHLEPDSTCIALPGQNRSTDIQMTEVEEADRIGMKEVDDAILYSWAEEGCLMTCDELDDNSTSTEISSEPTGTTRDSSVETEFDIRSLSCDDPFESAPMSIDPNVLSIIRPPNLFSDSRLPLVPRLGQSSTTRLPTTWNDNPEMPQGSKAVPRFAIRPRAMVKCVPIHTGDSALPRTKTVSRTRRIKTRQSKLSDTASPPRSSEPLASPGHRASRNPTASDGKVVIAQEMAAMTGTIHTGHSDISLQSGGTESSSPAEDDTPKPVPVVDSAPCSATVTHKMVDYVFLFVISWRSASVFRRVDTNYSE
ncbi:hypothetical protein QFC22_000621 [Naganishia vaughanmartiniae]|uniref:Uncharacterized protein n=1 Tax=Naganishia vaughanmartiniae TaxID=1424756 RepID=A0ACC2XQC3_9TREE|nr:hypothetical protein QFC22_000621 [Naganishia vaughanmartiniae]